MGQSGGEGVSTRNTIGPSTQINPTPQLPPPTSHILNYKKTTGERVWFQPEGTGNHQHIGLPT